MAFPLSFIFLITQILENLTPRRKKMLELEPLDRRHLLFPNFLTSPTPPLYAHVLLQQQCEEPLIAIFALIVWGGPIGTPWQHSNHQL